MFKTCWLVRIYLIMFLNIRFALYKVGDYMQEGLSRPGLLPLDKTSDDLQEFMNTIQQNVNIWLPLQTPHVP